MTKPTLYIETSVISYLVAKPSRDIIVAANQQVTREWWEQRLGDYDAYVSEIVVLEVSAGDVEYAKKRLDVLQQIPELGVNDEIRLFAELLLDTTSLPLKAERDALHIAITAVHNINYLATWNCRHIANAHIRREVNRKCVERSYTMPIICTPLELLGEEDHVD